MSSLPTDRALLWLGALLYLAGFGTGLALGAVLAFCPRNVLHGDWVDRTALAVAGGLAGTSWWLALR